MTRETRGHMTRGTPGHMTRDTRSHDLGLQVTPLFGVSQCEGEYAVVSQCEGDEASCSGESV